MLSVMLASCDPCGHLDCIADDYYGRFRIISQADGKDLVFGPNAIYDQSKIRFYTINGTDTNFFQYEPARYPGNGYDSILNVWFFPKTSTAAYIKLSDADTDTLQLTYKTYPTKCCGIITEISNFRYNNSVDLSVSRAIQEIKK